MAVAEIVGHQHPRILSLPPSSSSIGEEAVDFCTSNGLILDPWQQFILANSLATREDGKWAAFEIGLDVSRQNGKGAILEGRELVGLFLIGERLIIHSAHQFDTSLEAFRRLLWLIEEAPELEQRVKRVSRSHGEEGIELKGGNRIRFRTRTKGGGRGFSGDCLLLDEAMIIPEFAHGALLPTLSARPNPQVWYTGSAVDQLIQEHGIVFARIRERGHRGEDPSLAYFEWSVDCKNPNELTEELAADPELWAQANPGLGIRISAEHVGYERRSMDYRTFAVERLGVGDWPRTDGLGNMVIDPETWNALADRDSKVADPVVFTFDVAPDRSRSAIAATGRRNDGLLHTEILEHKAGTGWIPERLVELSRKHKASLVACDGVGPASSLVHEIEKLGVQVKRLDAREYAHACGLFFDAVEQKTLRHLGTPELAAALRGAGTRPLSDAWAWSRKNSSVDISPLVASTIGVWGVLTTHSSAMWVIAA